MAKVDILGDLPSHMQFLPKYAVDAKSSQKQNVDFQSHFLLVESFRKKILEKVPDLVVPQPRIHLAAITLLLPLCFRIEASV